MVYWRLERWRRHSYSMLILSTTSALNFLWRVISSKRRITCFKKRSKASALPLVWTLLPAFSGDAIIERELIPYLTQRERRLTTLVLTTFSRHGFCDLSRERRKTTIVPKKSRSSIVLDTSLCFSIVHIRRNKFSLKQRFISSVPRTFSYFCSPS